MRSELALFSTLMIVAATPCAASPLQPWFAPSATFNTYAMDDANGAIAEFNAEHAPNQVGNLDSAVGYAFAVGADLDRWSWSLGYERLPASSEMEGPAVYHYTYDIPADAVLARTAYQLQESGRLGVALGIGAGVAWASGGVYSSLHYVKNPDEYGKTAHLEGSGLCVEGFVEGRYLLSGPVSLVPSIGYRAAKFDAAGGENLGIGSLDYGGLSARFAFRFAL